jgi:hypothetical protein
LGGIPPEAEHINNPSASLARYSYAFILRVYGSASLCFDKLSIRPEQAKRVEGLRVKGDRKRIFDKKNLENGLDL